MYSFRNKARHVNSKAVHIQVFVKKMEITRVLPGRPSRTTSSTCTTDWEPML